MQIGTRYGIRTLGRTVKRVPSFLALLGAVWLAGCAESPQDRVVGIYMIDPVKSELPKSPLIEARMRDVVRNFSLKLRSDRSFVISARQVTEGTWRLDGDKVNLQIEDNPMVALLGDDGKVTANVVSDTNQLIIARETPLGPVRLVLRKTG